MARRRTAAGSGLLRKRSGPKRSLREGATLFLLQRPDVVAALLLGEPLGRGAQQRLMREYAATGAPAASHASFSRALQEASQALRSFQAAPLSTLLRCCIRPRRAAAFSRREWVDAVAPVAEPLQHKLVAWDTKKSLPVDTPQGRMMLHVGAAVNACGNIWIRVLPPMTGQEAAPGCLAGQVYNTQHWRGVLQELAREVTAGGGALAMPRGDACKGISSAQALGLVNSLDAANPQSTQGPVLPFVLLLDGAPQHTSQEGRAAAAAQGVVTLLTPPDSPDLNPVEQFWGLLEDAAALGPMPTSDPLELARELMDRCRRLGGEARAQRAVLGFTRRLRQVREAGYRVVPIMG